MVQKSIKRQGIHACIAGREQRKKAMKYDKRRYKRGNRIEIMFGRLKDWRRAATRYDKYLLGHAALASLVC
jgi:transposase